MHDENVRLKEQLTQLQEENNRLRTDVERCSQANSIAEIGIWDWDIESDQVFFNQVYTKMVGYQPEEITGGINFWKNNIHPEDKANAVQMLNECTNGKKDTFTLEYRIKTKSDHWIWVRGRGRVVLWGKNGKASRFIGIHKNISERKQIEEDLRKSENRFRLIAENAPGIVYQFRLDKEGTPSFPFMSKDVFKYYGYAAEEIMNDASLLINAVHPDDIKKFSEALEVSAKKLSSYDIEHRLVKKDGNIAWLSARSTPVKESDGSILWTGLAIDITSLKNAQLSLEESEDLFRNTVEHAAVGIGHLNESGDFLKVNRMFCTITGYTEDELKKMSFVDLSFPDDLVEEKIFIEEVKKGLRDAYDIEKRYIKKSGEIIWIQLHSSVVRYKNKKTQYVVAAISDITKRKNIEQALKTSEKKFRDVVSSVPGIVYQFIKKPDGTFEIPFISEGAKAFFTDPMNDIKDVQGIFKQIFPEDLQPLLNSIEASAKNLSAWQQEFRVKLPGKSIQWFRGIAQPELRSDNSIIWTGVFQEVTQLKNADAALRESEERFHLFMEQFPAAVCIKDLKNTLVYCNKLFAGIIGKTPDEIIGKTIEQYTPPEIAQKFTEENREVFEKGEAIEFEHVFPYGKGFSYWLTRKFPVYRENNEPLLGSVSFDISKRKHAEQNLVRAKEEAEQISGKLQLLFDNMADGFALQEVILDEKGKLHDYRYLEMNKACEDILSIKASEVIGKTHLEINPHNRDPNWKKVFGEVALKGKSKKIEYYAPKFKKHLRISTFSPKKGQFANIFEDITDRKKMEFELINAKEKAEESDRLKSAFLMNMSHEIRTPLNGIIGFSEMYMRPEIPSERRKYYAKLVIDNSHQLLKIMNDILDISMIETDSLKLFIEPVNVNRLLAYLHSLFKFQTDAKNLTFEMKPGLNEGQSVVKTDPERLKQILSNLISNAIKFTNQGAISFGCEAESNHLQFFVQDTGIGISSGNIDKIFDRFTQEEMEFTRHYGGTGLGLAISKKLTELLGGKIWVTSRKGVGSTFYVTIPYKRTSDTIDAEPISNQVNTLPKHLSILVVEDEEINYIYIEELLSEFDVSLMLADNGKDAVTICKNNPDIDVVLMDIKLPVLNGFEATRQIKKARPEIIIIAQTAYAMSEDKDKALQAGCDGYISKPIDAGELLYLLQKLVSG